MSSTWEPGGGSDAGGGSWPSGLGPPLPHDLAPEPERAGRGRRTGITAAVGALVIASVGFAAVTLTAGDGASSPEAAVEAFFEAVDREDAIGVVESLEPSERRLLMATVRELEQQGERLGLTDPEADLRGIQGLDLEVRGLQLTTEELGDGVAAVALSGSVSTTAELRELPLGPVIEDAISREQSRTDEDEDAERSTDELDLAGGRLVTVQRGGGWHVSIAGSIAEAIRRDADDPAPFPGPDDAIPAVGAADPEAAVREAIDAATNADVRRLIELTDPEEAEVLHRYGSLLVGDTEPEPTGFEVSDLTLAVGDGPDGSTVVTAESITMTQSDDESTFTSSYADGCTEVTWSYTDEYRAEYLEEWGEDEWAGDDSWLDGDSYRICEDDLASPFGLFGVTQSPGALSVVVVERDGAWFLRPVATGVESILSVLRGLDADQLQRSVRMWTGEFWLGMSDEVWDACEVARPADDADPAEAEDAYERCMEQLPADFESDDPYVDVFGPGYADDGFVDDEGFEVIGEEVPGDETFPLEPEDECYSQIAGSLEDPDDEIAACLQGLVDDGVIEPWVLDEFRCSAVYRDIPFDEGIDDEELDRRYQEADAAYEACLAELDAGRADDVPSSTLPPEVTTTTGG